MDTKEIITRLEIIKMATTIGDHSTILLQTKHLVNANSSRLNEIITLLNSKKYRQGLYLIKGYLSDMGEVETLSKFDVESEGERVLDIEDMLRMSPLAKETIKDYKRSVYTADDLEAFAKNIEVPPSSEYEKSKVFAFEDSSVANLDRVEKNEMEMVDTTSDEANSVDTLKDVRQDESSINSTELEEREKLQEPKVDSAKEETLVESIEDEVKEKKELKTVEKQEPTKEEIEDSKKIAKAVESANSDTPLDEISAEVLGAKSSKNSRAKVLSKYKTLREKFGKKAAKGIKETTKMSKVSINGALDKAKTLASSVVSKGEDTTSKGSTESATKEDSIKVDESVVVQSSKDEKESNNSLVKDDNKPKSKLSQEEQIAQDKVDRETIYSPIPHIEEKFRQSFVLYPPLKDSEVWVEEVIRFLKSVSKNSFTERDVKQLLDEYDYYLEKRDIAKASQVLLLAASTESKYARFLLARELFSGKVIKRDLKKSFNLMKELANSFYPEAVCDLGQFYEYGIGVSKDKKVAIRLYEKAFELGSVRATKHINRLKESSGILSSIFKFK